MEHYLALQYLNLAVNIMDLSLTVIILVAVRRVLQIKAETRELLAVVKEWVLHDKDTRKAALNQSETIARKMDHATVAVQDATTAVQGATDAVKLAAESVKDQPSGVVAVPKSGGIPSGPQQTQPEGQP